MVPIIELADQCCRAPLPVSDTARLQTLRPSQPAAGSAILPKALFLPVLPGGSRQDPVAEHFPEASGTALTSQLFSRSSNFGNTYACTV
jgi:hypothetical protein